MGLAEDIKYNTNLTLAVATVLVAEMAEVSLENASVALGNVMLAQAEALKEGESLDLATMVRMIQSAVDECRAAVIAVTVERIERARQRPPHFTRRDIGEGGGRPQT